MADARHPGGATVLVVGGAGFVGSHTCKALAAAGFLPLVYDNLSRGHADAVRWGPLVVGDLHDTDRLAQLIAERHPAAVLHFAAYAYVGESMAEPGLYWRNNVAGTASLLEAMRRNSCQRLVFSSTCAVYGGVHATPIDERTPCEPASTYGHTKLACEQMMRDAARAHGLGAIALRYFNAAGADPDGELGENHEPEPHIIPTVLRVAAGMLPELVLNGDDHPTPDGTCVRDFVHVADLANAHVSALSRLLGRDAGFEAFNLGTGRGYSLNEIVAAANRVTGQSIRVRYAERREGDPPYAVGAAAQAESELHWRPRYTQLDETIEHSWRWIRRQAVGAQPVAAERPETSTEEAQG